MTAAPTVLAGQSWRGDGLGGLDRGSRVWWRASETEWQPATIVSNSAKECSIALDTPAGQGTGKVRMKRQLSCTAFRTAALSARAYVFKDIAAALAAGWPLCSDSTCTHDANHT